MVNAFNDVNYTDETYKYSALWAINEVRKNADMPLIPSMGKDEFMERLYNEWRVEFAFEDHRFWDIRRWLIADDEGVMKGAMYGLQLSAVTGAPGKVHYKPYVFENRLWSDRSYLHPIKQTEIDKGYMLQNPGW